VPTPTLFAAIAFAGVVTLFPFMMWETAVLGGVPATASAWTSIVALAIFPSVLAFGLFQYGVKIVGPAVTGIFMYLMPPYGVALAVMLLGETLHGYHIAGMILVTIGVAVATLPETLLERFSLFRSSKPTPASEQGSIPDQAQSQKNAP
jgi:drug/metabolite transporter (DMT)-like permease